jgi:hypothetical protein
VTAWGEQVEDRFELVDRPQVHREVEAVVAGHSGAFDDLGNFLGDLGDALEFPDRRTPSQNARAARQ